MYTLNAHENNLLLETAYNYSVKTLNYDPWIRNIYHVTE